MATITNATDLHGQVTDKSQGFAHAKRPVTGVEINIYLTPEEAELLKNRVSTVLQRSRQTVGEAVAEIFGAGKWQLAIDGKTLTVTHQLRRNSYGARTTSRLAVLTLEWVNRKLQHIAAGR